MNFQDFLAQNGGFEGKNRGRSGAMLTPTNSFLLMGFFLPLFHFWRKSIKKCDRESADRQTHAQRQTKFITYVPCYIL